MASIYSCKECGTNLNLNTSHLYPATVYFPAGNKGTLSFAMIDSTKFRLEKEDKIRPFFETLDYWGIQRKRTKIKCNNCGALLGYIYDDGPPAVDTPGQFHFGPSQVIPRYPRYRLKTKALRISTETWTVWSSVYLIVFVLRLYNWWVFGHFHVPVNMLIIDRRVVFNYSNRSGFLFIVFNMCFGVSVMDVR